MPRAINKIIIHCADTWSKDALAQKWFSKDFKDLTKPQADKVMRSVDIGLIEIDSWHEAEGFSASPDTELHCGYHMLVRVDGTLEQGRADHEAGIHCRGQNHDSLAICLIGGRPENSFTKEQIEAMYAQLLAWITRYGLEPKHVFGHKEFNAAKTCPNITNIDLIRDELEIRLQQKGV